LAIQHLPALLMANTCRQEYENLPNPSTLLRDEPFFRLEQGATGHPEICVINNNIANKSHS
ncbi:hypothetical protein, partial [Bordetella parapertussis]